MEFNNVIDWLHFVINAPTEELSEIINEDFWLSVYLKYQDTCLIEKSVLLSIKNKLAGLKDIENPFWDRTLMFVDVHSLPNEVLDYLIINNIAIDTLGHLSLEDGYLWRISAQVQEAALTLGKRYYRDSQYTVKEFEELLCAFKELHWLWSSLIRLEPPNIIEKRRVLVIKLFNDTAFEDLKEMTRESIIANSIISSKKVDVIKKYYNSFNPEYLKAIAQNPITPNEILDNLTKVKNIKYAKQIRDLASSNLKAKHHLELN